MRAISKLVGNSGYRTQVDLSLNGHLRGSVDVTTGNLLLTFRDLRLRDLDTPITVGRSYNSRSQTSQDLSPGWRLNTGFEIELDLDDPDRPVVIGPTGAVESFSRLQDGSYTADGAFDAQLHRTSSGYRLEFGLTDGLVYGTEHELDEQGRVRRVADPVGDRVGDGLHGTVFDTTTTADTELLTGQSSEREGRQTTLTRDDNGRVVRITDSVGGALEYVYDGGRLVARSGEGLPPQTWEHLPGNLPLQQFTYGADGRLASVLESGRELLEVTYDEHGRVSRTAADQDGGPTVTTFEYRPEGTVVHGSDGSHRVFDAANGGVVAEDRQGRTAPRVHLGGTLISRLPRPVDPDATYHLTVDAQAQDDPVTEIAVTVDGGPLDVAIAEGRDPNGALTGTVEFMGDTFGVATLIVEIATSTAGNSVTTQRLVVKVPWSEPEPFPENVRGARRSTKGPTER